MTEYRIFTDGSLIGTARGTRVHGTVAGHDIDLIGFEYAPDPASDITLPPETIAAQLVEQLAVSIQSANLLRRELTDLGWSFESAEEIAGVLLKSSITNAFQQPMEEEAK